MVNNASKIEHFNLHKYESTQGLTTSQLLMVEENNVQVKQREKDINKLVQSIMDLNVIFKELAGMVAEQGTVLDR